MNKQSLTPKKGVIRSILRKGEIWLVRFKRTKETPKTLRPCLIISNDVQNEFNDLITK